MFEDAAGAEVRTLIGRLSRIDLVRTTFYLAGGTALALHLGHRMSQDIDLFTGTLFQTQPLREKLVHMEGLVLVEEEGTLHTIIDGVKVSFLYYPYPVMHPFQEFKGLNVAAVGDIACMKAVAISQRGEKKDFFDMVEILKVCDPRQLRQMFLGKYGAQRINCYHILKSLFYFQDAEDSPDPLSLNDTTWDMVKTYLREREKELTREFCLGEWQSKT